jgi:hypothetical protein
MLKVSLISLIVSVIVLHTAIAQDSGPQGWYDDSGLLLGTTLVGLMNDYEKAFMDYESNDYAPNPSVALGAGYYMGFIGSVSETYADGNIYMKNSATRSQIFAAVSKYLHDHPERWNEPAVALVTDALDELFAYD